LTERWNSGSVSYWVRIGLVSLPSNFQCLADGGQSRDGREYSKHDECGDRGIAQPTHSPLLPEIVSGFRLGFALTLLGTLIGEMFASQRGIGYMLVKAMETGDTATVMSLALLLVVLATAASAALLALDRRLRRHAFAI